MKLQFKQQHLSIGPFDPIELPSFVVLTGVNGSGKSHLLEAIEKGSATISGIPQDKIIKFNYETFKLENEPPFNAHQLANERESAWKYFQKHMQPTLRALRQKHGGEFASLKEKSEREDMPFLSLVDDTVSKYREAFESQIAQAKKNGQHLVGIYSLAKKISYPLDEVVYEEFCDLYRPYTLKNDFLPTQLGKVFWDYYVKYRGNQVNQYQNEKHGKEYKTVTEEEFLQLHGLKPWDAVNEILAAFDTLKYRVNSPEGEDYFGNFQLRLCPTAGDSADIQFSHLSSGEKVLMALVAAIYKAGSDGRFPEILLLDEVDASLHPAMMKNMLSVIENIFVKNGVKIILVTHSPTTVALAPDESIYVMNKAGPRRMEKRSKQDALSVLTQGFVTLEQGLKVLGQTNTSLVTVISEGHNASIIAKAFELYQVSFAYVLTGLEAFTGKGQLRTLFDFFSRVNHGGKVVFVWDCDVSHGLQAAHGVYPFIIQKNINNQLATKGIENVVPESVFTEDFVKVINLPGRAPVREFYEVRKQEFSQHVVANGSKEEFGGFRPLIEEVRRIAEL